MSLVPTWVRAVDGLYYKDPLLVGENWFLCFDDDDPPELVIKTSLATDVLVFNIVAKEILDKLGFGYRVLSKRANHSMRDFGDYRKPDGQFDFQEAGSIFLEITSPIPVPQQHDGVGTREDALKTDCVLYDFRGQ